MNLSQKINNMATALSKGVVTPLVVVSLLLSAVSTAADIELYLGHTTAAEETNPKVLIVIDTSQSMTTLIAPYDSSADYPVVSGSGSFSSLTDDYVYYLKSGDDEVYEDYVELPIYDSGFLTRKFINAEVNNCQASLDELVSDGFYQGRIKRYKSSDKEWIDLPNNNGNNISILDCRDDVANDDTTNAAYSDAGYPVDDESSPYSDSKGLTSWNDWDSKVTLYTGHYLRWLESDDSGELLSRLEVAQDSLTSLIEASPEVYFGLEVFNKNSSDGEEHGGRIVHGIQALTTSSGSTSPKDSLLTIINDELLAEGSTPITESVYEASLYFGSQAIEFATLDDEAPSRDLTIENSGNYRSPFETCDDRAYIVLVTDGLPRRDTDADADILNLSGITTDDQFDDSYLPALAGWMNNNDVNTSLSGTQTVATYTIGFSSGAADAEELLQETADLGGGQYLYAADSTSLTSALKAFIANIEISNETLTSASVAANNFDRTQTLDSVYYAMFEPSTSPRWQGNLKKYKIVDGVQQGANDVAALNTATGNMADNVQSYWSSSIDGGSLSEGGVAEMLRTKSDRVIYSDLGINNALIPLTYTDANSSNAFTDSDLATELGIDNSLSAADQEAAITNALNWINGIDVDDEDEDGDSEDNRSDIFGDPLHSTPLVLNYGEDIYIIVGTNHGVLHMFKDNGDSVEEVWAFMPKEFISHISTLRNNDTADDKVYGIDGNITSHIVDNNGDGIVNNDDKVWIYFGFRRGGNAYYALDVTNVSSTAEAPAVPTLKWIITSDDSDFSDLGQSWSQPKVIYSKLNTTTTGGAKPVLIFGGGYDVTKDLDQLGADDTKGKAIYMVDADTKALLWRLSATTGAKNTYFSGTDSIPASIATLDSDGDGLTDRLYAGDTGGNVWRIDMPGDDISKFSVFKLASLGAQDSLVAATEKETVDRRFFNEPDIVRAYITETYTTDQTDSDGYVTTVTYQQEIPYDAVLLGSGDRTNPLEITTDDSFFMIKDSNIITQQFTSTSTDTTTEIPATILIEDLYDYTDNPFAAENVPESTYLDVSKKSGWFIDLILDGEKSTASALVINNVVYFTTYTPAESVSDSCTIASGEGWLYAVDLSLGISKYDSSVEDVDDSDDRKVQVGEQFLGAPTLLVIQTSTTETETVIEIDADTGEETETEIETTTYYNDGSIVVGNEIKDVDFSPQTIRTYLYVTED